MAENDQDNGNDHDNGNGQENGNGDHEQDARATRILTDIAPRAWEHPADRAALAALRKIPVFDDVLRGLFGFFGEKPIRLAFLASSVRVSERQFPRVSRLYQDVLKTLDSTEGLPALHFTDAHRQRGGLRDGRAVHHPEFGHREASGRRAALLRHGSRARPHHE